MAKLNPESAWEFADAIKAIVKPQTTRRKATVQNIDKDGTIWVQLPGSSQTTPIQSTGANVSPGDTVLTELRGTSLHITENQTSPAIGENTARSIARNETRNAENMARQARTIADEAQAVAEATNQHFWNDTNGAHITDVTQDEWNDAVADNFSDYDPTTKPYHNQLLNSLGILLRTALNNLVSITRSAIAFYDGAGNAASNIVARFGSDGAQIGLTDKSYISLDYHSMQLVDKNGAEYLHVSDLLDANDDITDMFTGDGVTTTFILATRAEYPSMFTRVYVDETEVTSGVTKNALNVVFATAPANGTTVKVVYAPLLVEAEKAKAFTFGLKAIGNNKIGLLSSRFGYQNVASGYAAHAQNVGTKAASEAQTAIGKYNDNNPNNAFEIGNGTADNARSNAFAVKWDGTVETAKDIPWTELTLASGWTAYSTARTPMYRRVGSMVEVRGAVKPTAETSLGTSSVTFGTLPQGCRPVNMEVTAICQGSGVKEWLLTVDTNGNVCASRMRTMNSTAYQSAGTSEFMIFDVSFLAG